MKIGIVCYPTIGGSGILATELGHELARRGHEIHFITYEVPFRLKLGTENITFHEVEIYQYELFRYPDYALHLAMKMVEVSKRHDLDILHVHYAIPHATSAFLAKEVLQSAKPAVVTTLHGTDITLVGREPSYFDVVKLSIEKSDGVTAVSKSLKKESCLYFHLNKPVEVIYNFFTPDPNLIGKKPMREGLVSPDEKLLIHASNFRSLKRAEDVVHVFHRVRKEVKCKLLFLGSGSTLEGVRRTVHDYGLDKEVIFLGQSREIDPYLASGDLFLLPSEMESFGLAALESMAYGVPVIATQSGGIPEVVIDGQTGFLAPVRDVDAMAEKAILLLTDSALYQRMSKAAIEHAATHFSADLIVPQYEAFYARVSEER